jgi:hypothetical protein
MKTSYRFYFALAILGLMLLMASPAFALSPSHDEGVPGLNLTAAQILIVGFCVTGFVSLFRLAIELTTKAKIAWRDEYMQAIVYIAGGVLAWVFYPQTLPLWPDFGPDLGQNIQIFMNAWLVPMYAVLSAWFLTATLLYKFIIQGVYNGLGRAINPTVFRQS